jgi:sugar O-acyltransferase (sialic acid O-acetyltransferase NeuD family)
MVDAFYAVYGAAGCGRGIMPLARAELFRSGVPTDRLVFVDDNPPADIVSGQRVLRYSEFLDLPTRQRFIALAIANSIIREKLAVQLISDGATPWTIRAENVVVMDDVELGTGALLSPFVTLTSNIRIGNYFHANIYSYVEHDCVIGDFVTFAPGVKCNGNVVVEDHVYIGTGAIIKQGLPGKPLVIGKGAVIGMGAVVTKSVLAGMTVVGNPARPLVKT